jgi:hypothetical protein
MTTTPWTGWKPSWTRQSPEARTPYARNLPRCGQARPRRALVLAGLALLAFAGFSLLSMAVRELKKDTEQRRKHTYHRRIKRAVRRIRCTSADRAARQPRAAGQ